MIYGNELILGDNFNSAQSAGAHVFAISRQDGHLLWSTQVDSHPAAQVTANPVRRRLGAQPPDRRDQLGPQVEGWDAWNAACIFNNPGATWCPSPQSPDFDFGGAGPNLLVVRGANGGLRTLVGVGQKSGVYWAFDPRNGNIVWNTLVGPGTPLGGVEWGTGLRSPADLRADRGPIRRAYNLANGQAASGGSWAALDSQTGKIDWQVSTPGGSAAFRAASEANGVVYAGDMSPLGDNMFALDASSGNVLWSSPASRRQKSYEKDAEIG